MPGSGVQDTGVGIDPAEVGGSFWPFVRLDAGRTRETGGGGPGLAITRSIVLAHGGTLSVEGALRAGSRFTVQLPLAPDARLAGPGRSRVRLLGWILLLAGIWSVGRALFGGEPMAAGGIVLVLIGAALLTARGRAVAAWIGEGVLTGLCIMSGLALLAFGAVLLLAYSEVLTAGVLLPVRSLLTPVLFLGSGLLLVLAGARRLWRLRGLP